SRLNDYYCDENKGSYRPQFLEANSYEASHIDNSIPRKEKDPGSFTLPCYINNVCFDNALADLGTSVIPLLTYLNLGLGELAQTRLTVELEDMTMKYPNGIAENVLVGIGKFVFPVDFIILDMPEDVKVPLILGRSFLFTAHTKINVFKRKITLRVRDEKIIFKKARLMRETLVLNKSLDPLYGDCIELNDLNVPLELRRDQVNDLMPIIEEGEVINEPMIDIIKTRINEEKNSEDEVAKTMAETMEQYMSKTRANYGSGIARPKIDDKGHFELKGQFLKELRDNTFSGSDHEDANEHTEKVLEIVDLFHVFNITQDQIMLRVFPMSLTGGPSH
nr:hypothetical protein [Tanacetum cinerariifolium]